MISLAVLASLILYFASFKLFQAFLINLEINLICKEKPWLSACKIMFFICSILFFCFYVNPYFNSDFL